MDKAEFLKNQFLTLRREVEESKNRVFQTMGFGLVVVPGSHFLAQAYQIDTVTLSLPILVVVVALVYLSENNAIMRCGRYIKYHIEPQVADVVGWEAWLERRSAYDTRAVDKHMSYAFYLLFFVYFAGSVFIASRFALSAFGTLLTASLLGGYIAVGIWFLIFLFKSSRVSTTTTTDTG
jgi:hypothetical protein